jgi:hypothetical protein
MGLREEARKSWDHIVSDEIIYLAEPSNGKSEVPHELAKKYFQGDVWFEMHRLVQATPRGKCTSM